MSTRQTILTIIEDVAPDVETDDVADDADLRDELDIDSMDFLKVLVGIQEQLGVSVPEVDYGKVRTLAGLVSYVDERSTLGEGQSP